MRIMLAPMEGVVEHHVRDILTRIGGLDGCVTEFIRVTDQKLPYKVFYKYAQELESDCKTPNGTPVRVQLLGSKPEPMAINAQELVNYGAKAIDLNFGCPAKTVNAHEGGACLLRTPDRVYAIIKAVRDAVPREIPVTAKIRLGFEDRSSYMDNARAVEAAGADELTVHARSKVDGYKPPAYWHYIADIRAELKIPVVGNGEIWTVEDYLRCREQSAGADVMLGRGLLACPDLARQIKARIQGEDYTPLTWAEICTMLYRYYALTTPLYCERNCGNRVKQWLMYLSRQYPQATVFFEAIKRKTTPPEIEACFQEALAASH
ncbi:tRNA-dihydrouridine synthase [Cellvibrio sp. PSBB023]|uniref:tRNA dihydrouridine synthase n=1 Tax=Cellvibrio sp. PSBB023 TaxID=1945512 RepID=UPI00098F8F2C|nr:tRNA-dihydrouridine synthase [Cellvibrio sp. PSBB023]AQT59036.1 tRNA dihydrouridine(16) synthase DusC [Cellvibrio sp. PSBB023]